MIGKFFKTECKIWPAAFLDAKVSRRSRYRTVCDDLIQALGYWLQEKYKGREMPKWWLAIGKRRRYINLTAKLLGILDSGEGSTQNGTKYFVGVLLNSTWETRRPKQQQHQLKSLDISFSATTGAPAPASSQLEITSSSLEPKSAPGHKQVQPVSQSREELIAMIQRLEEELRATRQQNPVPEKEGTIIPCVPAELASKEETRHTELLQEIPPLEKPIYISEA